MNLQSYLTSGSSSSSNSSGKAGGSGSAFGTLSEGGSSKQTPFSSNLSSPWDNQGQHSRSPSDPGTWRSASDLVIPSASTTLPLSPQPLSNLAYAFALAGYGSERLMSAIWWVEGLSDNIRSNRKNWFVERHFSAMGFVYYMLSSIIKYATSPNAIAPIWEMKVILD